jgi:hypothetical protein
MTVMVFAFANELVGDLAEVSFHRLGRTVQL